LPATPGAGIEMRSPGSSGRPRATCGGSAPTWSTRPRPTAGLGQPPPEPEAQTTVDLLLAALDPDRRAAFVLTQLLGCSYAEAAAVCDCPIGTIRSRVARAREDLDGMLRAPAQRPRSASGNGQF
jgi:DNA-directed RNA polymerase specialized sigma24 family protein